MLKRIVHLPGFSRPVQVPPRLLGLQESGKISGKHFPLFLVILVCREMVMIILVCRIMLNLICRSDKTSSSHSAEMLMLNLIGRLLLIHGITTLMLSDDEAGGRGWITTGDHEHVLRYEEISSFPPNGVKRFQFSTRTGHYSQVIPVTRVSYNVPGGNIPLSLSILELMAPLGKLSPSKTDEFSEKFQTAFDPPPSFSESYVANFFRNSWPKYRL